MLYTDYFYSSHYHNIIIFVIILFLLLSCFLYKSSLHAHSYLRISDLVWGCRVQRFDCSDHMSIYNSTQICRYACETKISPPGMLTLWNSAETTGGIGAGTGDLVRGHDAALVVSASCVLRLQRAMAVGQSHRL